VFGDIILKSCITPNEEDNENSSSADDEIVTLNDDPPKVEKIGEVKE